MHRCAETDYPKDEMNMNVHLTTFLESCVSVWLCVWIQHLLFYSSSHSHSSKWSEWNFQALKNKQIKLENRWFTLFICVRFTSMSLSLKQLPPMIATTKSIMRWIITYHKFPYLIWILIMEAETMHRLIERFEVGWSYTMNFYVCPVCWHQTLSMEGS